MISVISSLKRALLIVASALFLAACGPANQEIVEVFDDVGSSLGSIALEVSCSAESNELVRRGLALLHNMTYSQAEQDFSRAAELDADCAMANWGQAMTLFHPLWPDVPTKAAFEKGRTLLVSAREKVKTALEGSYVEAAWAYFDRAGERTEAERLQGYYDAWQDVTVRFPRDVESKLFYSLAGIAVAGLSGDRVAARAITGEIAEAVLEKIPDHPGALHYSIHSFDLPQLAQRGLSAARVYGKVAPENSHALHMTSHIFTRVGSWEESIEYNLRAAAAGRQHPVNGAVSMHYLHASDYLVYAYLQRGDVDKAEAIWEELKAIDEPIHNHAGSAYTFAAVPVRIALELRDWSLAKRVEIPKRDAIPWDQYPYLEAIVEFSRGLGAVRTGDASMAARSLENLEQLEQASRALPIAYDWGSQVEIQKIGLQAWIEYESGNQDRGIELMKAAADLEASTEKNPVTPGEVLPAAELYGDMLLEAGRPADAIRAYEKALARTPNRLNSLYGAGRAAELAGNSVASKDYFTRLVGVVDRSSDSDQVIYARARS